MRSIAVAFAISIFATAARAAPPQLDTARIEQLTGAKGKLDAKERTFKVEVTGLHNHFADDSPRVMFMHIAGMGDQETLAGAIGKVFAAIKETAGGKGTFPHADIDPARTTLDPKKIDAVLGTPGEFKDGVYKVVFGRETTMHGDKIGSTMGVNTWAAFAGSDDEAIVDGDFAVLAAKPGRRRASQS